MDVGELFQGIAVIIDDEINNPESTISRIREFIQNKNIPVAVFNEIPRQEIVPALSDVSFIILDWDFINRSLDIDGEERLDIPAELQANQEADLLAFIKALLEKVFVPVFIFTAKPVDRIKEKLREEKLWTGKKQDRIFIQQKNDINEEGLLFGAMEKWLKEMPSVYVLKEWEKVFSKNKNAMFLELYGYSPNWVNIIWNLLKNDSIEHKHEFGDFVTRSLNNRISEYSFDEEIISISQEPSIDEISHVIEGERFLKYTNQPSQAYTGDLFKQDEEYFLNIRAQCDLSRKDKNGNYDPCLYYIKGKKLNKQDIVTNDIELKNDETLYFNNNRCFTLKELSEICRSKNKLKNFNENFYKNSNSIPFHKGAFLERNNKVIIGCVAGENAIQFDLELFQEKFSSLKDKRIGRILPPYITRIQQKCAQYMVREGVMPVPKELFADFQE